MPSFEMIYEEEEDVLEITLVAFEEHFARTIPLNDNIVLHTDTSFSSVWGMTFYSYWQLFQVNETFLEGLRELPADTARQILVLINKPPASHFLQVLDAETLRAQIKVPNLQQLLTD